MNVNQEAAIRIILGVCVGFLAARGETNEALCKSVILAADAGRKAALEPPVDISQLTPESLIGAIRNAGR